MKKTPSLITIIVSGWLGFMFGTAVAALIPSLQLLTAPILCGAPYSHGVVEVHNFSYGFTSGYSTELRCANAEHQEQSTSVVAVVGLLWLYGWVAALLIRGIYYWGKAGIIALRETYWRRRLPAVHTGPHAAAATAFGTAPSAAPVAPAGAPPRAAPRGMNRAVLVDGRVVAPEAGTISSRLPRLSGAPNPVEQLAKLADLHDRGALTDAEFATEKAKILSES